MGQYEEDHRETEVIHHHMDRHPPVGGGLILPRRYRRSSRDTFEHQRIETRRSHPMKRTLLPLAAAIVLLLPTTPMTPPPVDAPEPGNVPDFTALASLGGCPALSIPLGEGIGLQLVGAPGSDLRLLELGEILAAVLDAGE